MTTLEFLRRCKEGKGTWKRGTDPKFESALHEFKAAARAGWVEPQEQRPSKNAPREIDVFRAVLTPAGELKLQSLGG
jgi:hypothetical protein